MSNFVVTYKVPVASGALLPGRLFLTRRSLPSVRSVQSTAARLHRVAPEAVRVCTFATVSS